MTSNKCRWLVSLGVLVATMFLSRPTRCRIDIFWMEIPPETVHLQAVFLDIWMSAYVPVYVWRAYKFAFGLLGALFLNQVPLPLFFTGSDSVLAEAYSFIISCPHASRWRTCMWPQKRKNTTSRSATMTQRDPMANMSGFVYAGNFSWEGISRGLMCLFLNRSLYLLVSLR